MGILDGKIAVVTGAGRGIGRGIALLFASEGAKVVVNDLGGARDGTGKAENVADQVVEEIRAAGGTAVANYDTVATVEGGRNIFQSAIENFGALDILVNNAGILRDVTLVKMEEEQWDEVINVHLRGTYCCTRPFAQYIRETARPDCRIISMSSSSGLIGNFGQSNYGAAKAGIAGFSRVMALELRKYGCTVNAISPAGTTRMTIDLREKRGAKVDVEDPEQNPNQVAAAVAWLASDKGKDITGQIIRAARGTVGIFHQPAVIKSFTKRSLWTVDDMDKIMPQLIEAKEKHDALVKEIGDSKLYE